LNNVGVISSYVAAIAVLALLAVVPGPEVAVVTRLALRRGPLPAIRAALGVALGLLVWGG
jgi:threonine/homoserine/homoserine lactone efflux protein